MSRSPRTEALAYRVWAHCTPLGWDCTVKQCADALGVSWQSVRDAAKAKGWLHRFRSSQPGSYFRLKPHLYHGQVIG
jgi:hypothetical protein